MYGLNKIGQNALPMPESTAVATPILVSGRPSGEQQSLETAESLPKSVALRLLKLMDDCTKTVNTDYCNADAVKTAVQCAAEIRNMIRLHFEVEKIKRGLV